MIGCLYIPHYPTWVFEHRKPRDRPVVVVSGGRVITAGKAARRAGVEPGISAERVHALCPGATITLRDPDLEIAVWEENLHHLNSITPFIENAPAPYVYFRSRDIADIRKLAASLKAQVAFASNRSIALLASMRAAPGNVLAVRPQHQINFLKHFAVEKLEELGFDVDMIEQLMLLGFNSLGDAHRLSLKHLKAQFGDQGAKLFELIHPEDEPAVSIYQPPRVLRETHDFDWPCNEPHELLNILDHLIDRLAAAMNAEKCRRLQIAMRVYRSEKPLFSSRVLVEPVSGRKPLRNAAHTLIHKVLFRGIEIETLAIEAGALRTATPTQTTLFRQRPSLLKAVRAVHKKFPGAIKQAIVEPGVLFSEDEVRFEPFPEDGKQDDFRTRLSV
ncbi:MAG: hypothetical protein HKN43_12875 [Rhodothermales bacterium]|nr:hypothetical protein [Rhodothermales bacterium]